MRTFLLFSILVTAATACSKPADKPATGSGGDAAAKPDFLLRMASMIGKRVSKYGGDADRALASAVESVHLWAQELPGVANGNDAEGDRAPRLELTPAG